MENVEDQVSSCHITDLFFHSEFTQFMSKEASNRWLSELSSARNRPNSDSLRARSTSPSSGKSSPQGCGADSSSRVCRRTGTNESRVTVRKVTRSQESISRRVSTTDEGAFIRGLCGDAGNRNSSNFSSDNQECGNRIGLLFTDAAHTILGCADGINPNEIKESLRGSAKLDPAAFRTDPSAFLVEM